MENKTVRIENEEMKNIGINILTSEACAISLRLLCELTAEAMQLYLDFTGIQVSLESIPHSQYNDRSRYSCFLTWPQMQDMLIMHYANQGYQIALMIGKPSDYVRTTNYIYCANNSDELRDHVSKYAKFYECKRFYCTFDSQPRRGLSNIHAWTGLSQ